MAKNHGGLVYFARNNEIGRPIIGVRIMDKTISVVVICGGISTEREVSLRSGNAVYNGLIEAGFKNVKLFELNEENIGELLNQKIDIAYLALHGKGGEDGKIQSFLELTGIPYTGPGVQASVLCMNKILTKMVLSSANIPTAKYIVINKHEIADESCAVERIIKEIGIPAVVKAPSQGSSIGVTIVKEKSQIMVALQEAAKYDDDILVERFLNGTEVTLPIIGNDILQVLPEIEITSEREFYDYKAKYTNGLCHHIIPARITTEDRKKIREYGEKAYKALGCVGSSRIDFIIDKTEGPKVVEINTIPGMTQMSLFPDSANSVGISFSELVTKIVELGLNTIR